MPPLLTVHLSPTANAGPPAIAAPAEQMNIAVTFKSPANDDGFSIITNLHQRGAFGRSHGTFAISAFQVSLSRGSPSICRRHRLFHDLAFTCAMPVQQQC